MHSSRVHKYNGTTQKQATAVVPLPQRTNERKRMPGTLDQKQTERHTRLPVAFRACMVIG